MECNPAMTVGRPYGNADIEALEVVVLVGVTQIRPLLLAIFNNLRKTRLESG